MPHYSGSNGDDYREGFGWPSPSFVRSLLRAGVQPTLDPSAETFMSVQCASPGRGREIVRCVRCMCELCRVKEGLSRRKQLVRYC